MIDKDKLIESLEEKKYDFNHINKLNLAERLVFEYTLEEIIYEIKEGKYETECSSCFDNKENENAKSLS